MAKLRRQVFAAIAGSVSVASSSMSYGWLSPAMGQLTAVDGEFRLDRAQVTHVALLIEAGCLVTSLLCVATADRLGRRWPMLATGPLFVAAWAVALCTRSTAALYVKRLLEGFGLGVLFTVGPLFLAEIASPRIRGAVLLGVSVSWYLGMFVQYCLGTYLSYDASALVNLCVPLVTTAMLWPLPESPYHLLARHHRHRALAALAWYRDAAPHEVTAELAEMQMYLEEDRRGGRLSLRAALSDRVHRRCFVVMGAVVLGTIMTGITAIYAFSTEIFADTSAGPLDRHACSLLVAAVFLVASAVSCAIVDRVGRRPLLVATSLGCCLSNAATGLYFYCAPLLPATLSWLPLLTVGSYCVFVSVGLAPILVVFQGELFPSGVRALGAGLTQAAVTLCSLVVLQLHASSDDDAHRIEMRIRMKKTYKVYRHHNKVVRDLWGVHANYALYSAVGGLCTVYLYLRAPETNNKTFAEIFYDAQRSETTGGAPPPPDPHTKNEALFLSLSSNENNSSFH